MAACESLKLMTFSSTAITSELFVYRSQVIHTQKYCTCCRNPENELICELSVQIHVSYKRTGNTQGICLFTVKSQQRRAERHLIISSKILIGSHYSLSLSTSKYCIQYNYLLSVFFFFFFPGEFSWQMQLCFPLWLQQIPVDHSFAKYTTGL